VLELQSEFPGSELVCEVFNDLWLKGALKGIANFKMRRELASLEGCDFPFRDQGGQGDGGMESGNHFS